MEDKIRCKMCQSNTWNLVGIVNKVGRNPGEQLWQCQFCKRILLGELPEAKDRVDAI